MDPSHCLELNQAVLLHLTSIIRGCNCGYVLVVYASEHMAYRWQHLTENLIDGCTFGQGPPSSGHYCKQRHINFFHGKNEILNSLYFSSV